MATTYDPTTADLGTITSIDRTQIVIDPNVRKDIRIDKSFISNIRVRGFEQYPVGYTDDDGLTHITIGQRRVSGALEIGWPVIPVVVKPKIVAEADRAEELRILAQLAENEQRAPLADHERIASYKQLALIGVTEDQIARKTNAPKQHITTALAVAASTVASKVLQAKPITLDQAAIFVEFEGDDDAIKTLTGTANDRPEQLDHTAARLRQERARQVAVDKLVTELEIEGWQIVRSQYQYGYTSPAGATRLEYLYREGDKKRTQIVRADVADLPGRVAVVFPMHGAEASAVFFLKKPADHGFASTESSSGKGPLTEKEKEARRQKRVDRADFTAATEVRRTWLQDEFLPRKHQIGDVVDWILKSAIAHPDALRYGQAHADSTGELTVELLRLADADEIITSDGYYDRGYRAALLAAIATTTPADELRILLAHAIARVEYVAGNPKDTRYGQFTELAPYLRQLQTWGYTLSDIEQRLLDEHTKKATR